MSRTSHNRALFVGAGLPSWRPGPVRFLAAILLLGSVLLQPGPARATERLTLLSLNLFYSEGIHRLERLTRLADGLAQAEQRGEGVDVVLLQEVVAGSLAGTDNSAQDLQGLLAQRGLFFHLAYVRVNDFWGLIQTGNAVLSRHPFLHQAWVDLPGSTEYPSPGIEIAMDWKALYVELDLPGWGPTPLFDIHLCANCVPAVRLDQTRALLEAVQGVVVDRSLEGQPLILAGDFNIHLADPDQAKAYQELEAWGFEDAWARLNGCRDCCLDGGGGCTYGLPGNPWAVFPISRTDYVFSLRARALSAEVLFTGPDGWVSDHSALLVGLELP